MAKRWYVVHAYSGFEKQVKRSLEDRIQRAEMEELFGDVLVPTEEVVEMKAVRSVAPTASFSRAMCSWKWK